MHTLVEKPGSDLSDIANSMIKFNLLLGGVKDIRIVGGCGARLRRGVCRDR